MFKYSSAKYYKKAKKGFKKNLVEGTMIFLKNRKTKHNNVVANKIKIFQKMKIKSWKLQENKTASHTRTN